MTHQSPSSLVFTAMDISIGIERFLTQQNIDRYLKLLDIASDGIQRRQIENLLEEERYRAMELDTKRNDQRANRAP
jgi:hypothetical protein